METRMKIPTYGLILTAVLSAQGLCRGQSVIRVVAGGGSPGASGDGGPAVGAFLSGATAVTVDDAGNLYLWEAVGTFDGYRIRKVNTAGIISTFAGNGTLGYSGDGGPATSAQLSNPVPRAGLATDSAGNVYIADGGNRRVRKVDTSGIITTVAGNGMTSVAGDGDGKHATDVALCNPTTGAADSTGNLLMGDGTCLKVRKVDTSGVIHTAAGSGKGGFSGDGGQATDAKMAQPFVVATDSAGNFYIVDEAPGSRVRKVNKDGIISTIAGNGTQGSSGDGGPATSALLFEVRAVAVDRAGNVYIDDGGKRVRKVDTAGTITTIAGGGKNYVTDGASATDVAIGVADLAVDESGDIYIANYGLVYKVSAGSGTTTGPPSVSPNGVVNAASFQRGAVPNSWVTISGTNLASKTDTWNHSIVNGQLPTSLDGVSVSIGGKPAYVYFISPGQINVLAPDVSPGPVPVTVTNSGGASAAFTVVVSPYSPAFFEWPNSQPVATRQDFSYAAKAGTFSGKATIPAKPGDVLILWGTGFGPTNTAAPVGVPIPSDKTYATASKVTVTINNVPSTVYGAALAPGAAVCTRSRYRFQRRWRMAIGRSWPPSAVSHRSLESC
jgi:uncharacterized protein (TIGR03437 family)